MSLFQSLLESVPSSAKKYVNRQVGFAATVAEKLKLNGMTQRELADKLGKKESYISRVLSGDANPTLKTISELEDALGADVISFNLQKNRPESSPVIMFGESFRVNFKGDIDDLKVTASPTMKIFSATTQEFRVQLLCNEGVKVA